MAIGAMCERIAQLNDMLRVHGIGGQFMITAGVREKGHVFLQTTLEALKAFSEFTPENDPYKEHDFGMLFVNKEKLFWKIDYYDPSMKMASEDPSDPKVTRRILTIMLAEEY